MPLFIDRLPLHSWTDQTRTPPLTSWSVRLPGLVTEPGLSVPPAGIPLQEWVFDPGNTGDAFAWRHHLLQAGLDPDTGRGPHHVRMRVAGGIPLQLPLRQADFWLVSNIPSLQANPFPLRLGQGIPFVDLPTRPDPQFDRPLLGIRALRRARLRVELDFDGDTVSVWTPDPPLSPPAPPAQP
jgi:hypothetical protein